MFVLRRIDHVALTVRDVERSIAWYRDVFGLERRHEETWGDYPVMMFAGDTAVALFQARGPVQDAPDHGSTAIMRHLAFQVDRSNFMKAQETLRALGIATLAELFQPHSRCQFRRARVGLARTIRARGRGPGVGPGAGPLRFDLPLILIRLSLAFSSNSSCFDESPS